MDSFTNFDPNNFSRGAGAAVFSAVASTALSIRAQAKADADARATGDALASWEALVADLEADVARLSEANAAFAVALRQRDDQLLIARAEIASLRLRLQSAGVDGA